MAMPVKTFESMQREILAQTKELSIGQLIEQELAQDPNWICILDSSTGREWTAGELRHKMLNIAAALIDKCNLQPETPVAIIYNHSDLMKVVELGVWAAGGSLLSIRVNDTFESAEHEVSLVRPELLFCARDKLDWASRIAEKLGKESLEVIVMDEALEQGYSLLHVSEFLDYDRSKSSAKVPVSCRDCSKELAFFNFTSGSTGVPKCVPVTHASLLCYAMRHQPESERIPLGCASPISRLSGRNFFLQSITRRCTCVIIKESLECLIAATETFNMPDFYLQAIRYPRLAEHHYHGLPSNVGLSEVKTIGFAGDRFICSKSVWRMVLTMLPSLEKVENKYGSTEDNLVSMATATPDQFLRDPLNCGPLVSSMRLKVCDLETGAVLGCKQVGELRVSGPTVFQGYYDANKGPTRADRIICDSDTFDSEGFHRLGDAGMMDELGNLHVFCRISHIIRTSMRLVYPHELEQLAVEHPAVLQAAAVRLPSKQVNEDRARLFLQVQLGCHLLPDAEFERVYLLNVEPSVDIAIRRVGRHTKSKLDTGRRHKLEGNIAAFCCRPQVDRWIWPTGGIILVDELPVTSNWKFDRLSLSKLDISQIEICEAYEKEIDKEIA